MSDEAVEHARALLHALGLDETVDPELRTAPERFTELLKTMFSGVTDEPPVLSTFPVEATDTSSESRPDNDAALEPVVLLDLPFQSMCVHHLVPMFGSIDVAYVPRDRIVGFGSIGRAIDFVCARPQVQERIVTQLADLIERHLEPEGLLVRCRARQLCMEMRGAKKRGTLVSTASRGSLRSGERRLEIMRQFAQADSAL
ncbi:GTP cyclohydrolase I FolE [Persicimonas caeni]|uniref:GTP cyclohydrolase I n=1 Tax=Persicimonas caeni TaxID=2292766 RepID=A0A4Y6Q1Z8_PERCE|nr:GTP cyclohydrolase I [Persicimonas caeni]QDG54628.1 GTP cyclohydrolase I FolE [Persicimonas caeni]QED35849.1 GTP cyclohydrolase I FolE [Persicimonas caeni]